MREVQNEIKTKNFEKIYALFFQFESLSRPQVVQLLGLSIPTVTANMNKLEEQGLIAPSSYLESSGGRPAQGYSLVADAKVAVGVEIKAHHVECALIDLKGQALAHMRKRLNCADNPAYLDSLCNIILEFIASQPYALTRISGVGISLQAIIDLSGRHIIYSAILPLYHLDIQQLEERLGLRVRLCHDVENAAIAEIWQVNHRNAVYVALSEHLGGTLINEHRIEHGRRGYAGAFEHLLIKDQGRPCYCGRQGCFETYASLSALLHADEDPQTFFTNLRAEQQAYQAQPINDTVPAASATDDTAPAASTTDDTIPAARATAADTPTAKVSRPNLIAESQLRRLGYAEDPAWSQHVGKREESCVSRWNSYLSALARGLSMVYLMLERDLILGGELSHHLNEDDLAWLEYLIINQSSFTIEPGFIHIASVREKAYLIGAALYFIAENIPPSVQRVNLSAQA